MKRSVLVIAGEISGDMHAAGLIREARARDPELRFWGVGGDAMQAAGAEILYHVRDMAALGLVEVLKRYSFFRRVFQDLVRRMSEDRPDAVLLVDYPGFNLRFAKAARTAGAKVVYYVCPQVWAWHRSRIPKMAELIDRLLVIFPFEVDVFKGTSLKVEYVGHPLVDAARAAAAAPERILPWRRPVRVALLPGSRRQEIDRILPSLLAASRQLEAKRDDISFLLASPSEDITAYIRSRSAPAEQPAKFDIVTGDTREVLRQATAAMVASGTATLEACLMICPMLVVYRTARMTYEVGRRLVKVPHLGMVNLIAGRGICPEFIQDAATPEALSAALLPLLDDTPARRQMVRDLRETAARLGDGGAALRAADALLAELNRS